MKCPACDAGAPKGARFCSRCGAAMTAAVPERSAPVPAAQESLGVSMAKGAAVGAVISIPVPFIGPFAGALVGAGVAAYKKLSED